MPNNKRPAPPQELSPQALRREKQRAGREAMARRRERIFSSLVIGKSYPSIAREEQCSIHWVRKIVADTLRERRLDPPAEFQRLQAARLNYALEVASAYMTTIRKIEGLDRYLKIVEQIDRCYANAVNAEAAAGARAPARAALIGQRANPPRALPAPGEPIEGADVKAPVSV